jgi:phosphoribosylanthranilate isomerase
LGERVQSRTRVKMCGTTRLEDALAAVRCGVNGLGFIFYGKSPRYIPPEQAAQIIKELPPFVDRVGVFVNAPVEELVLASKAGLSYLQLHGNESVDYCREVRERLPFCGIIKAFRVGEKSQAEQFSLYNEWVDGFLLDTYIKGARGGTGETFDWTILDNLNLQRPVFLAGGLSPENIIEAINAVRPFAVDINSGVELRPGEKDHARLEKLMRLVARTWFECNP